MRMCQKTEKFWIYRSFWLMEIRIIEVRLYIFIIESNLTRFVLQSHLTNSQVVWWGPPIGLCNQTKYFPSGLNFGENTDIFSSLSTALTKRNMNKMKLIKKSYVQMHTYWTVHPMKGERCNFVGLCKILCPICVVYGIRPNRQHHYHSVPI